MKSKIPPVSKNTVHKKSVVAFDFESFRKRFTIPSAALFVLVLTLFLVSIFKNISYPLFWADESMTIVGAERVIQFGYPKVHDGKNVFYDLRHSDPELGIDKKTDAYVGGTSWLQYYFGTIGAKLAAGKDDLYEKTGIIRFTFAAMGVAGLIFLAFSLSALFRSRFERFIFAAIFFFFELFSISLALLIREARYYALNIFLVSVIAGIYILSRGARKINPWLSCILLAVLLWLSFFSFSSVYFILLASIGLIEIGTILFQMMQKNKNVIREALPFIIALLVSFMGVFPFLSYFKTFEISSAMAEFNNYSSAMYWDNVSNVFKYFSKFEALWLFLIIKCLVLFNIKRAGNNFRGATFASISTFVFAIVYSFAIAKIPNFIYTRYIIPVQPLMVAGFVCDVFILFNLFSSKETPFTAKNIFLILGSLVFTIFVINKNSKDISGHLTEISQQYKGPLDYSIPYIKDKFKETDTLVIATNYEESSYIYYLKSNVIVGFIGNNLAQDSLGNPDVIVYRKPWGNFVSIFQKFMSQAQYERVAFPTYDNPVNNIPELNFMPAFNHHYKEKVASSDQEATELYIRK